MLGFWSCIISCEQKPGCQATDAVDRKAQELHEVTHFEGDRLHCELGWQQSSRIA